jgi:hypothetical protein
MKPPAILDRRIQIIDGVDVTKATATRMSELRSYPFVVLLGEPGSGKSTVLDSEAALDGVSMKTVRALMTGPAELAAVLYLDALDEYRIDGQAADKGYNLATTVAAVQAVRWRLTCRAEDWQKVADTTAMRVATGGAPIVVAQLMPLARLEAEKILESLGEQDPRAFLTHAERLGASGLLESPLSLTLLQKAVSGGGEWPRTRFDLFDSAIEDLSHESNPLRQQADRSSARDIRQAAEMASLTLLVSGSRALWRSHGLPPNVGSDSRAYVIAYELNSNTRLIDDMLDSSLFRGEGEEFKPMHRSVAEYLGGRALAQAVVGTQGRAALPLKRAIAMITGCDRVPPTELRGLYAWFTAHLAQLGDEGGARQLVQADAATVLLYGDARAFSTPLRRTILEHLGRKDPFFRISAISDAMVSSLAADDLVPEFTAILTDLTDRTQRLATVFEALSRCTPVASLRPLLRTIALDPKRQPWQRSGSAVAWINGATKAEMRELFEELALQPWSSACEELRLDIASQLPAATLTVQELRSLLVGFESIPQNHSVGRLISLSIALRTAPPQGVFDDPLDSWLPLAGRREDSIAVQQFLDSLLAASIETTSTLTCERLWRWVSNARRHTWESLPERATQALRAWLSADATREADLFAAILADNAATEEAPWIPGNYFTTVVGHPPSAFLVRNLLANVKADETTNESKKLLPIIVAIAANHPDPALYEQTLEYVSGREDGLPHAQHLTAKRSDAATQQQPADLAQARIEQRADAKAKYIETLRPLLQDLSIGKHPGHLSWAAQQYFFRPDAKGIEGSSTGVERVVEHTNPSTADALVAGWCHLAKTDLGGVSAAMIGKTSVTGQRYFVELAALAGLDRLLTESQLPPIETMPITLAIAVLNSSPLIDSTEKAIQLDTWALERLDVDPTLGSAQLLDYWTAALDEGATYLVTLQRLGAFESRAGALRQALDRLLSSRPDLDAAVLDRAILTAGRHLAPTRLLELADAALANSTLSPIARRTWSLVAFTLDPKRHKGRFVREHGSQAELEQLQDALRTFGPVSLTPVDPHSRIERTALIAKMVGRVQQPVGAGSGNADSGAAYLGDIANNAIHWIAAQRDETAGKALKALERDSKLAEWHIQLRFAHSMWARAHRERLFRHPSAKAVTQALAGQAPLNAADLRAVAVDALERERLALHTSPVIPWKHYWSHGKRGNVTKPHIENECRNQLLHVLQPRLERYQIAAALPEAQQAEGTRTDALILSARGSSLPIEVKRHFHPDVWTAPNTQLQGYANSEGADGSGIYLVFWFGNDVKSTPKRPKGGPHPKSAVALEEMLKDDLDPEVRELTEVIVFDVSKPSKLDERSRTALHPPTTAKVSASGVKSAAPKTPANKIRKKKTGKGPVPGRRRSAEQRRSSSSRPHQKTNSNRKKMTAGGKKR